MDETRPIRAFQVSDVVYAEPRGFDVNMTRIGDIGIGRGQSPHMGDLHISTEISLGAVSVPFGERNFEWSFSTVFVVLEVADATVIGELYRETLQPAEIEVTTRVEETAKAGQQRGGEIEARAEAGLRNWLPTIGLGGGAHGSASASRAQGQEARTTTERKPQLDFVLHTGRLTFTVGGPMGDPRRPDTRDLRGPVISPVRRVAAAEGAGARLNEEIPTPLARLAANDPAKPVLGRITVRTEPQYFVLNAAHRPAETEIGAIADALAQDKRAWLARRCKAEDELRRRVAALAAGAKLGRTKDSNPARGREVELFACGFCFVPEGDAAGDEA